MCKALTSRFRWRREVEPSCSLPMRIGVGQLTLKTGGSCHDYPHSFYRDEGADTVIFLVFA
jgi:hypothetical protein